MTDKISISIIMPVYNSSRHINESIDSVINQPYTNCEIVIVDDNSTDNASEIIEKYMDFD